MTEVDNLSEIKQLEKALDEANLPEELTDKAAGLIERLSVAVKFGEFSREYTRTSSYIDWITSLPWGEYQPDKLDLVRARQVLDKHHYGLVKIKERILEYMAVMKLKKEQGETPRAPVLCLVGLVGTGKTTLARAITEALGRDLIRIPFGGIEESFYLRGRSLALPQAEPGQVIKGLRRCQNLNPVILLDEIDRIAEKAQSGVMGVLVELLDPAQNDRFVDYFIDYPIDLSRAFFITTCNNTRDISQAVLDRLEVISMPSYSDEEKIKIAKDYLLPKALEETGLSPENVVIKEEVWPKIVRPLGYDAGVRTLQQNVEKICRQVAKKAVENKEDKYIVDTENVTDYVPGW